MRKIIYLIALIILASCSNNRIDSSSKKTVKKKEIQVEINYNIETIGIILNLSELGDYVLSNSSKERNYEFIRLIRNEFKDYQNHPAVIKFNKLNELNLAHFNHFYYGLSFSKLPEFKLKHPKFNEFYSSDIYNHKQIDSLLIDFDSSIRDFYNDANLNEFYTKNNTIYHKIKTEIQSVLPTKIIQTMENYFGMYNNEFVICPSLTIPNDWNFGPEIKTDTSNTFYYLAGPSYDLKPKRKNIESILKIDSLGFNDKENLTDLAIHEFGHSFVRFLDNEKYKKMYNKLSYLNSEKLKKNFEKIGEGTEWKKIFEEHLVRANEIMIWREMGKNEIAETKLRYEYEKEGVLYIKEFVSALEKYRKTRNQYKTFEDYFPKLIMELERIKNQ
jgi:hypothetical protein